MCSFRIFLTISAILFAVLGATWGSGLQHGMVGKFIQNVSEEGVQEYYQIIDNETLTIDQINQETVIWAQKYGVLAQFKEFQENVTEFQISSQKKVRDVLATLSVVQEYLENIWNNTNQTIKAQRNAEASLSNTAPLEYQTLFFILSNSHMPDLLTTYLNSEQYKKSRTESEVGRSSNLNL